MPFIPDTQEPDKKPPAPKDDGWVGQVLPLVRAMPTGPMGVAATGVSQAMQSLGKLTDEAAYRAGGFVTDKAAQLGLPAEVAGGLGYGTNVAIQAAPVLLGGYGGKTVGKPLMDRGAETLYRSALKPDKASNLRKMAGTDMTQAQAAVRTGLEQGINVSKGGLRKVEGVIDDIGNEVKSAIARSNATVDKNAVLKSVDEVIDRFKLQATPQRDLQAIREVIDEFSNNPLFRQVVAPSGRMSADQYQAFLKGGGYMDKIPVQLAQDIKSGTYKILSKKYGELKGAEVEAMKAVARGLKDEISKAVPQVAGLNKTESQLLNLKNLMESRLAVEANKNPMGLGWLAERPLSALGFLVDRSGATKSLLARGLYSADEALPYAGGALGGGMFSEFYMNR